MANYRAPSPSLSVTGMPTLCGLKPAGSEDLTTTTSRHLPYVKPVPTAQLTSSLNDPAASNVCTPPLLEAYPPLL